MNELRQLVLITLLYVPVYLGAQFLPNTGQGFQFAQVFNPSFAGFEPYAEFKTGYRYQWTGFDDLSPTFVNLQGSFRLKQPLNLLDASLRGSANDVRDRANLPAGKRAMVGVGFNVFHEDLDLTRQTGGGVHLSLHYPLSRRITFGAGIGALLQSPNVSLDDIYLGTNPDPDPYIQELLNGRTRASSLNVRAGILLYSKNFYIGGTYIPVWNTEINSSDLEYVVSQYRGSFQLGLSFDASDRIRVKPSVWGVMYMDNEWIVDYACKAYFNDRLWAGLGYRTSDTGMIQTGFFLNNYFSFAYDYEFSMGQFRQFNGSTHEIILILMLNNRAGARPTLW